VVVGSGSSNTSADGDCSDDNVGGSGSSSSDLGGIM